MSGHDRPDVIWARVLFHFLGEATTPACHCLDIRARVASSDWLSPSSRRRPRAAAARSRIELIVLGIFVGVRLTSPLVGVRSRALVDGNKRLALVGTIAFYGMNGLRLAPTTRRTTW